MSTTAPATLVEALSRCTTTPPLGLSLYACIAFDCPPHGSPAVRAAAVLAWLTAPKQIETAAQGIYDSFYGGSSGLDDMAAGFARDSATAALTALTGSNDD